MANEPLITVIGRLGNEPELKFTKSGKAFATFSLATTPRVKQGDEYVDKETLWFKVVMWRDAEEFIEQAKKGSKVVVTGKLTLNSYNSKSGESKSEMQIEADGVGFIPTAVKQQNHASKMDMDW